MYLKDVWKRYDAFCLPEPHYNHPTADMSRPHAERTTAHPALLLHVPKKYEHQNTVRYLIDYTPVSTYL